MPTVSDPDAGCLGPASATPEDLAVAFISRTTLTSFIPRTNAPMSWRKAIESQSRGGKGQKTLHSLAKEAANAVVFVLTGEGSEKPPEEGAAEPAEADGGRGRGGPPEGSGGVVCADGRGRLTQQWHQQERLWSMLVIGARGLGRNVVYADRGERTG